MRIIFAGTPEFAARHLEIILESEHEIVCALTQPDRKSGRGKKLRSSPVKQLAEKEKIQMEGKNKVSGKDFVFGYLELINKYKNFSSANR